MEMRSLLVVTTIISVLLGKSWAQTCSPDRKCIPFNDCADYRSYVGIPSKNWPNTVQNEVKSLICAVELLASGKKLYKVCCLKPGRHLLDMDRCGKQVTSRIAHGKEATVFQFPWMALLRGFDGKFHCGGSLIAERYVLTATHCRRKTVYSVRLGETDLSTAIDCIKYSSTEEECAEPPQDILAETFIRHPKYSASQKKNDVALVKLVSPAKLNDNVRPICLPLPEALGNIEQTRMLVAGWGFTENDTEFSNKLRYAYVPIVDLRQCNESLALSSNVLTVDESQLCAGGGSDKADNCQGDSGGPLKYFGNGKYVVHGVVSFGQATCGMVSEPGIYTKVQHYLDWIIDNLQ